MKTAKEVSEMPRKEFKEYDIDSRIMIIKFICAQFKIEYWQTQWFLHLKNPVIKIYSDNVCAFDNVEDFNDFYFYSRNETL